MKKTLFILIFFIGGITFVTAQLPSGSNFNLSDPLLAVKNTRNNTKKFDILCHIGQKYMWAQGDSAIKYFKLAEQIAINSKSDRSLFEIYWFISTTYNQTLGNYPLGLHFATEQLKLGKKINLPDSLMRNAYFNLSFSYAYLKNRDLAFKYIDLAWPIARRNVAKLGGGECNLAKVYNILEKNDSALVYNNLSVEDDKKKVYEKRWSGVYVVQGDIYRAQKKYDSAIINYKISIPLAIKSSYYKDYLEAFSGLTSTYAALNRVDSAIYYGSQVVTYSKTFTFTEGLLNAYKVLYKMYKVKNIQDSSFKYLELSQQLSEQLYNSSKINEAQNIALGEETKAKELAEQKTEQQKQLIYTFIGLLIFTVLIYVNLKRGQKNKTKKIEEDRKNKELAAARDLQISMLPKRLPQNSDLDIAAFIRSSTEVGGDYYDFMAQEGGNIYSICGDATGHGVASGMMVSITKAGLKGIGIDSPKSMLQKLNNIVKEVDLGKLRMSLNIVEIKQDEVYLSSAAMPPIYLYKASSKSVEELIQSGLPLGGLRNETFEQISRNFESGDVLIQLSDGLPEAPNAKGEPYDYDRLKSLIQASGHLSAQNIIDVLIESVDQWLEGKNNPDDITLVITKKI